jgi:phosphoribosylaminoimidazolecarboxamide formyltransferase/IMP cyclohydrolase
VNAVVSYINGLSTKEEKDDWSNLFVDGDNIEPLTLNEKFNFLENLTGICLASDAFFPFSDNIDVATSFGTTHIIQPGGSIADKQIVDSCDQYGIAMCMTGSNMRMFLH